MSLSYTHSSFVEKQKTGPSFCHTQLGETWPVQPDPARRSPPRDARAPAVVLSRAGRTVPGCDGHPAPLPERIRGATAGIAVRSLIWSCGGRRASKKYKIISLKPFLFNLNEMMRPPVSQAPAMYQRLHKCAHPRMSRLRNVSPLLP